MRKEFMAIAAAIAVVLLGYLYWQRTQEATVVETSPTPAAAPQSAQTPAGQTAPAAAPQTTASESSTPPAGSPAEPPKQ
jgi:hypothetical protein